jgi:hypothetical protein
MAPFRFSVATGVAPTSLPSMVETQTGPLKCRPTGLPLAVKVAAGSSSVHLAVTH